MKGGHLMHIDSAEELTSLVEFLEYATDVGPILTGFMHQPFQFYSSLASGQKM